MWDSLTQEQKWGFQYAAERRNAYNAGIEGQRTNWTAQEMALEKLRDAANQLWQEVLVRKNELFRDAFFGASAQTQATIQSMLNVPDVIQSP